MDEAKLQAIRERAENTTQGPWRVANDNQGTEYFPFWVIGGEDVEDGEWFMELHVGHQCDAEFVAHAKEDVPKLLDTIEYWQKRCQSKNKEIERLQKELDEWELKYASLVALRDDSAVEKERDEWKAIAQNGEKTLKLERKDSKEWEEKYENEIEIALKFSAEALKAERERDEWRVTAEQYAKALDRIACEPVLRAPYGEKAIINKMRDRAREALKGASE